MTEKVLLFLAFYLAVINITAACFVIYDKSISKLPRGSVRRVSERTFVFFSAIGGGIGTLGAMLFIHHKTKSHNALLIKIACLTMLWSAIIILALK